MTAILDQIEDYWTKRADSFSEGLFERNDMERWRKVLLRELPQNKSSAILDIGTGPGFFSILLAREGYRMTAVDYTAEMLEKAKQNAAAHRVSVAFSRMDAQHLEFEDSIFDAAVTRNLTWNLEDPRQAYKEWRRVLKPGGILLNFDAPWYEYLYDDKKNEAYQQDRKNSLAHGIIDESIAYPDSPVMEEISRHLIFSRLHRPAADMNMLIEAGFSKITLDQTIWDEVFSDRERITYASTPYFMIRAIK